MKRYLAAALVFIIAAFFYASIWVSENNTLSECLVLTGFVMMAQLLFTILILALVDELE